MLATGTTAPGFSLPVTPDQKISLDELRGKKVILAFYPADWSPVCGDQLALYNEMLQYFKKHNAELVGISVDGKWCHISYSKDRNLHFPLLSDFEPKGEIARQYEVYDENAGECKRALYIIDEDGIIRWNHLSPVGVNPGADGILDALESMGQQIIIAMALRTPVNKDDHIQGNPSAKIELLEYGDYQCPYCQRAYPIVKRLQQEFGDNLKLAFRNFPLTKIHPDSKIAAIASEAAGRQGKFWEMHDHLFEDHSDFSRGKLVQFAEEFDLDIDQFQRDLNDEALASKVEADFYGGMRSGVNATPTFFINGEKFDGNWQKGELSQKIRELLD